MYIRNLDEVHVFAQYPVDISLYPNPVVNGQARVRVCGPCPSAPTPFTKTP